MTTEQLRQRIAELEEEKAEHDASFQLRWKADMRAIKLWQAETGEDLTWPDHADLVVWLLEKIHSMGSEENSTALLAADKAFADYTIDTIGLIPSNDGPARLTAAVPRDVRRDAIQSAIRAYAASLLSSAPPPASEPDADVVEQVARAMYVARVGTSQNCYEFDDLNSEGQHHIYDGLMLEARAALSAMRPAIDQEKLAEIRRKHIATSDCIEQGNHRWDEFSAEAIHKDRAAMLAMIGEE